MGGKPQLMKLPDYHELITNNCKEKVPSGSTGRTGGRRKSHSRHRQKKALNGLQHNAARAQAMATMIMAIKAVIQSPKASAILVKLVINKLPNIIDY
jgi:hypothetical protein